MATIEVLDYLTRLEAQMEANGVPSGERKLARREVRHLIDDLAFRFAAMDERVMPEELDYARALEAIREPHLAAATLEPARPRLRRVRKRKLVTSLTILALLAVAVGGLFYLAGTQEAEPLLNDFTVSHLRPATDAPTKPLTTTRMVNFTVPGDRDYQLLRFVIEPALVTEGTIRVTVLDPEDADAWSRTFTVETVRYAKIDLPPQEGRWRVIVDFEKAYGAVTVNVDGIRPV
ncbi:MAG TPA: hypothetical protein VNZ52_00080 [Candidatus Thermoplasmatota archaeon]|nr:hypothetical protein [Candidatus Thermoplasmatota archaeon]